jgi:hypothetical protein
MRKLRGLYENKGNEKYSFAPLQTEAEVPAGKTI